MSFKPLLINILLFLLFSYGLAERFYYLGTLGDGINIQMDLVLEGTTVSGHYYYESVGDPIELSGNVNGGTLLLKELGSADGQPSGTFEGSIVQESSSVSLNSSSHFTGYWQGSQGERLPFSLEKVVEFVTFDVNQVNIRSSANYPFFIDTKLSEINAQLQPKLLNEHINFLNEGQMYSLDDNLQSEWLLETKLDLHYVTQDLVSMAESFWVYTGGAHGNIGVETHNFSLHTGKVERLSLADLFKENADFLRVITPLILDDLRHQEAAWVLDGSVEVLQEKDLSNFTFSPRGLRFVFEPYVMGPYVQGTFFVELPFESIQDITLSDGPLARFTKP